MIRIAIADDHRIIREGLDLLLARSDSVEIIAQASDGPELIELLETTDIDVVLLDVRMPKMTGLNVLESIKELGLEVAVVMLSMYGDPVYVSRAIELGASGYLLKSVGSRRACDGDRDGCRWEVVLPGRGERSPGRSHGWSRARGPVGEMTLEQLRILQLLADGVDNSGIADALST